jgi:hypothetical protein
MISGRRLVLSTTILLLAILTLPFPIGIQRAHALSTWSTFPTPKLIDFNSASNDRFPNAFQARDGTLWLVFSSDFNDPGRGDIFFTTYVGGIWTTPVNNTGFNYNSGPVLAQLTNGTIMLFWAQSTVPVGQARLFYQRFNLGFWSRPVQITSPTSQTLSDFLPSATVTPDGSLWLFWTRSNTTCTTCSADQQLYYKTLRGGAWSTETKLTADTMQNYGATAMVGRDGVLRVVWSKGTPTTNFLLYLKSFNGTGWSPDTLVDSQSSLNDEHPSLIQDRNGTLWMFWGRNINPTLTPQYILESKYSLDNGQSWTGDVQLTNTPANVNSFQPSAVQSSTDKTIWLFYSSQPSGNYGIYAITSNPVFPIHDVAITSITPSTSFQYPGGFKYISITGNHTYSPIVTITVVLKNLGDVQEKIPVSLVATNGTVSNFVNQTATINPSSSVSVIFAWDTTNVVPARYGFKAAITVVGESPVLRADNAMSKTNLVHIDPLGDVDQDGQVTITDVSVLFFDYGQTFQTPSRWYPYADVDWDGFISIVDVSVAVRDYGMVT